MATATAEITHRDTGRVVREGRRPLRARVSRAATRVELFLQRGDVMRREWVGDFYFWHLSIPDDTHAALSYIFDVFDSDKRQPPNYYMRSLQAGDVVTLDGARSFRIVRRGYVELTEVLTRVEQRDAAQDEAGESEGDE